MAVSMRAARMEAESTILDELVAFRQFGRATQVSEFDLTHDGRSLRIPVLTNEFWTAKQRQGHSLHEVSYRACFKAELPAFFIARLTKPGDIVFDPFMGRGTTPLEAALQRRVPWACDVNPLSTMLALPRLTPPSPDQVRDRLASIRHIDSEVQEDLLVFYHVKTLQRIQGLRRYFQERSTNLDSVDRWIRMVAINRLTGHSPGFFSVYSMPPNQAVSLEKQRETNAKRKQVPPPRDVDAIIVKKTKALLRDLTDSARHNLAAAHVGSKLIVSDCRTLQKLPPGRVALSVTSPPFLDIVDYAADNWLRCWFAGIDIDSVDTCIFRDVGQWRRMVTACLAATHRLTRHHGWMAFEVGEVRNGSIRLEEHVVPCAVAAGWKPVAVVINAQNFTKTSNCWGVSNNRRGTNTNRIVLLKKEA
jgi:hypothetical protein